MLKGLGHTWSAIAGILAADLGGLSGAWPGEKGASIGEAVWCGTKVPPLGRVRTRDWASGQVEWKKKATSSPRALIRWMDSPLLVRPSPMVPSSV